jgi:hypothetical protein
VLVALFILAGGLLAGVLAQRRYLRQIGDLADQAAAVEVARDLMAKAMAAPALREGSRRGTVTGRPAWWWTVSVRREPSLVRTRVYRLTARVVRQEPDGGETCVARLETMRCVEELPDGSP